MFRVAIATVASTEELTAAAAACGVTGDAIAALESGVGAGLSALYRFEDVVQERVRATDASKREGTRGGVPVGEVVVQGWRGRDGCHPFALAVLIVAPVPPIGAIWR